MPQDSYLAIACALRRRSVIALLGMAIAGALFGGPGSGSSAAAVTNPYRDAVMADAPRAYWRLAEASGTTAADETGANPGIYHGDAVLGQPSPLLTGPDTAVFLDGIDDHVVVPDSDSLDATDEVSVEAWVKRTKAGSFQVVVGKPGHGASRLENYALWINTYDLPVGYFGDGVSYVRVMAREALDTGWHHIVTTYDNATARLYVDGELKNAVSSTVQLTPDDKPLKIGRANYGVWPMGGGVDEVAVYGTALSQGRVMAHYTASRAQSSAPEPEPEPEPAGTFHVSPSGSNSNPGTATAPWRTVQKALNALEPGERALVRSGTYTENLHFDDAGTSDAPITLAAYPGERPVLEPEPGSAANTFAIEIRGSHFRLEGFVLQGAEGYSSANVFVEGSAHHVEIADNEIRNSQDHGIYSHESAHHVQVSSNWIHHNGANLPGEHQQHGIYLEGDDHVIANNVIHDHPYGFGIVLYDRSSRATVVNNTVVKSGRSGIVLGGEGGVDNAVVRNNIFAFNKNWGVEWAACPTSGTVDHNVIYGHSVAPIDARCSAVDRSGGNEFSDPLFVDLDGRDLRLREGSPAVDYALADFSPSVDREDTPRPQGPAPDAGAFERRAP